MMRVGVGGSVNLKLLLLKNLKPKKKNTPVMGHLNIDALTGKFDPPKVLIENILILKY